MMTPKECSRLSVQKAGYGTNDAVVKLIQDDARKELLEEIERLKQQIEKLSPT
jgi:hypothetical protein